MHYIPAFLRPISQLNTGLESNVETKVEEVDQISTQTENLWLDQLEEYPALRYEEALQGKSVIEHGRKIKVREEVDFPNRHWWVVSDGFLENIDPNLRDHADIFDLVLAINLCIDAPVAFSQSPGQTVSGAYRVRKGALEYRGELSQGSFPMALFTMNEIPSHISLTENIDGIYKMVRKFRSISINTDEDMDIRIGLHMYDDALTSSLWTSMSNLYFVCENVLCSGRKSKPVQRIPEVTDMNEDEADNWRIAVNRLKHPDKGEVPSLHQQTDLEIPTLSYMRETANAALIHAMRERFSEFETSA